MFSGIIEELGEVKGISRRGVNLLLEIRAEKATQGVSVGDSVSVNGVCLTAVKTGPGILAFEVIPATARLTNLGALRIKDKVNLERSLKMGDRISGHFVTGHIDCLGIIRKKNFISNNLCFQIAVSTALMKYCLTRGSVAVDGISLTLADQKSNTFSVNIIHHTLKNTTLGFKGPSDKVNIEFDILAKSL
jgi:riboflavin synthase